MAGLDPRVSGSFGFFECEDDRDAARALLGAAERWLAARGLREALGPMNFSLNQECGLLIEGFDSPPFLMMAHNPPRYRALVESLGFTKRKDLYAWRYDVAPLPGRLQRLAERSRRAGGVTVRSLDPARFEADARTVLTLFNDAWRLNWGFTPMIAEEFDEAVRELRRIVDPALVLIAEKEGRAVAIAVSLPNLNEALRGLDGRLFPFGLFRLLWRLKVRRPRTARCLMLGIEESARAHGSLGLLLLLFSAMNDAGLRRGVARGELSWTLEDNDRINAGIAATGATRYKTYRIYAKEIRG